MGLSVIESNARAHDKAMARSQALVHFIGRGLQTLALRAQRISTPDYETLLSMQRMVQSDSWQLFWDMQRYNPYTRSIRKNFLKNLHSLDLSLTAKS
jgi:prephenate dehydrogenase